MSEREPLTGPHDPQGTIVAVSHETDHGYQPALGIVASGWTDATLGEDVWVVRLQITDEEVEFMAGDCIVIDRERVDELRDAGGQLGDEPPLCTIAYQAEAYDSAAAALGRIVGYTVTVVKRDGETFDAAVGEVTVDPDDGQYRVHLLKWDEATDRAGDEIVLLDIYDDIERLEVL